MTLYAVFCGNQQLTCAMPYDEAIRLAAGIASDQNDPVEDYPVKEAPPERDIIITPDLESLAWAIAQG